MTDPVAALVTRLRPILDQGIATFIAADGEQDEMAALDEMTHYLCTEALAFAREQLRENEWQQADALLRDLRGRLGVK